MIGMFILMTKSQNKARKRAFIQRFYHKNERTAGC